MSSSETLLKIHDKWELTKILDQYALPYPKTILVEKRESLKNGIMNYPFMIKPLNQEAGKGIVKIDNEIALNEYLSTSA